MLARNMPDIIAICQWHDSMNEKTQSECAIGFDVGGTKCAAGLILLAEGRVLARRLEPTRPERGGIAVLDDLVRVAASLKEEAERLGLHPAAIGIGICELVSREGEVLSDATVKWKDLPIADRFAAIGLPIVLDADVRAAARGEAHFGAGCAFRSFLYVTVGTGISACLVTDKTPYAGARGLTGTFASSGGLIPGADGRLHSGPPLEQFAAGPALAKRFSETCPGFSGAAPDVLKLADSGDPLARLVVESAATALGAAVAQLVNILDPEAVVIGGGLGLAEGIYRKSLMDSLHAHVWSELHRDIELLPAQLGSDAGIIGAALATVHS
jgi:glucokinase